MRAVLDYVAFLSKPEHRKQKALRPKSYFDENLRDIPANRDVTQAYVDKLKESLTHTLESYERVGLLGEIGVYQRQLEELDDSEKYLRLALEIIESKALGIKLETQQKIRLAHTLQWKQSFTDSNVLFFEIILICRQNQEARQYLDFALQHAGKNFFDERKWSEALNLFEEALTLRQKRNAPRDQIESTETAILRTKNRTEFP